jgi:hypothetical protein
MYYMSDNFPEHPVNVIYSVYIKEQVHSTHTSAALTSPLCICYHAERKNTFINGDRNIKNSTKE